MPIPLTAPWFHHPDAFFEWLAGQCSEAMADYLEGVVFGPTEMYVTQAVFSGLAPATSNYTWLGIYYQSIRRKHEDWLTASDYIWRWDTDWFWCSRRLHAQNRLVRLLATKWLLNSRTWQRVMRLSNRLMPERDGAEPVIQDVQIPLARASEFLEFLLNEVGITPVWICPFRAGDWAGKYRLFAFAPGSLHINFGFWDSVVSDQAPD